MSEDTKDPNPKEKVPATKPVQNPALKKSTNTRFNKNINSFVSPKAGSSGKKGGSMKGGSMKKGK